MINWKGCGRMQFLCGFLKVVIPLLVLRNWEMLQDSFEIADFLLNIHISEISYMILDVQYVYYHTNIIWHHYMEVRSYLSDNKIIILNVSFVSLVKSRLGFSRFDPECFLGIGMFQGHTDSTEVVFLIYKL